MLARLLAYLGDMFEVYEISKGKFEDFTFPDKRPSGLDVPKKFNKL
jgi:hypothetical protein